MGIENDDGDGDARNSYPCSICLDLVSDGGDRSWAKLQCGHRFHLDCIGSAFNMKGAMQCPNCRKIEKGQWLYANGCRLHQEFNMEDWTHDEDLYDLGYSEMSFGVHWCPFGNLTQLPSSFEEGDFSSTAYHDILGQHAIFAEHTGVSSASHPCPYFAYVGPIHPSTSNPSGTVSETSNFNHWNGPPVPSDMPTSFTYPAAALYHRWEQHSSHFSTISNRLGASDQPPVSLGSQRAARGGSEVPRSGSFIHPYLVGHSSAGRTGNSVASSMIPPYPGSNARARDRVQALQAYYQPPNSSTIRTPVVSSTRRSSGHNGFVPPPLSPGESARFVYIPNSRNFQEETHQPSRVHAWDRDNLPSLSSNHVGRESIWRAHHQNSGGSDTGIRSSGFRSRPESERMPPQNW